MEVGRLQYRIVNVNINAPYLHDNLHKKMYPTDARQAGISYGAPCSIDIGVKFRDSAEDIMQLNIGKLPVMVKSKICNLYGLGPDGNLKHHEEQYEAGGFFVINGIEKFLRMIIVARSNYVFVFERGSYVNKGYGYTPFCAQIRCVKPDRFAKVITLHYLNSGNISVRVPIRASEYYIPIGLLLKATFDATDRQIYEKIVGGDYNNTFITERADLIVSANRDYNVTTQRQALYHLGKTFKEVLVPYTDMPAEEVGQLLIDKLLFVHLETNNYAKFELLVLMMQKLLTFVSGKIAPDNMDVPSAQEVLLPGHLYLIVFQQKLRDVLNMTARNIQKRVNGVKKEPFTIDLLRKELTRETDSISKSMDYLLATGNIRTKEITEAPQQSGYSVGAERLNFLRYLAHYRSIHRGAFFAETKTTSVRKLYPESWGFFCCVHTPDGGPCGLLNHLTANCIVTKESHAPKGRLASLLGALGMVPVEQSTVFPLTYLPVIVNGQVLGKIPRELAPSLVNRLRLLKTTGTEEAVPATMEIGYIPPTGFGLYPSINLYTTAARLMRPVLALSSGKTEYIGTQEQLFMTIAVTSDDLTSETTHQELHPTQILSVVAGLTPFSDFNQSPRNMYQCQMAKQTMGTPFHAFPYRTDGGKVYRIQHPQKPLVRNMAQEKYNINDYPHGCNAVVAVISYTGYDMEDAMIINKSAYERGFGHASVYTTEFVNIVPKGTSTRDKQRYYFARNPEISEELLDEDGLPYVGRYITPGEPYYSYVQDPQKIYTTKLYKGKEPAHIESVTITSTITTAEADQKLQQVTIKLRLNRNPVIGDKFSSRHGQKGTLSQLWPEINMPFSESGMKPDCIINPHAFPSRMTIGMLVESMAGKAGALHGFYQEGTPFQFDEKNTATEYFGEQLRKAGFNYYGNEPMYSGITGEEFHADIYLGVVYYQRLRHMVKDKFQVRRSGPINRLHRQPVKGRKVGGGVRFGEMERDSLIAHGASYLLLDRLMESSDFSRTHACKQCGSILTPIMTFNKSTYENVPMCHFCDSKEHIVTVAIPYVYRYLSCEFAAVNVRMFLEIKE
eukprot:Phypoly_transcript_01354.p1 GENE.Phypoly_transcript_01354~~Phypoly_transcript_01354.p1  ORF type:complete len:1148 (+),score=150.61 Phypoly_transcript_01354:238-3444(+)